VKLPNDLDSPQSLKECLEALPCLHTLEIVDSKFETKPGISGYLKHTFRGLDFPSIRRVTIPLAAHPILCRFPNLEELVCFGHESWKTVKPVLTSVRGPYAKERTGEIEPVLKSFALISGYHDKLIVEGT